MEGATAVPSRTRDINCRACLARRTRGANAGTPQLGSLRPTRGLGRCFPLATFARDGEHRSGGAAGLGYRFPPRDLTVLNSGYRNCV